MTIEPVIALAFTPDPWVEELHRFLTDHGGALVATLVVDPTLLAHEDFGVLVADADWPAMTVGLVSSLHDAGRRVVGVARDADASTHLRRCGVDAVVVAAAQPRAFVDAIVEVAGRSDVEPVTDVAEATTPSRRVVAVGGPSGTGRTEVACALAAELHSVLVDADEVAPALAARLGLALEPNLRTLVDAVEHDSAAPHRSIQRLGTHGLEVVAGLANVGLWNQVRGPEVVRSLRVLARRDGVVVDTAATLEDIGPAGRGRYAVTRAVLADADVVVAVGLATPLGVVRMLGWLADLCAVRPDPSVHLVLNRAAAARRDIDALVDELLAAFEPLSLWCLPEDPRVTRSGWRGTLVGSGPFARAVHDVACRVAATHGPRSYDPDVERAAS